MAAASTLHYGRQKKSVYGKASKSSWTSTSFFDESDDELAGSAPAPSAKATTQRSASVKASYPVRKAEAQKMLQKAEVDKTSPPKATKAKPAEQDPFVVPSSDEETFPPPKAVRNPLSRPRMQLVNDQLCEESALAPWEQQQNCPAASGGKSLSTGADNVDAQLRTDLAGAARAGAPKRAPPSTHNNSSLAKQALPGDDTTRLSSAAARLAARKRIAEANASTTDELPSSGDKKRLPAKAASESTPHKRARTADSPQRSNVDVMMADDMFLPLCDIGLNGSGGAEVDIHNFPNSSADDSTKSRQRSKSPRIAKKPARRSKPTTYGGRAISKKGMSAPTRLAEMLPTDSDMTETSTASPSNSVSRAGTPQHLPSTPPLNKPPSPHTAIRSGGNLTPKQAQLWDRLLQSPPVEPSPSALAMKDLTISAHKPRSSERARETRRHLPKSQSGVGRRKTRLVDRLKASADSSSEDESADSSSESEDVEIVEAKGFVQSKPSLVRSESARSRTESASAGQSQSRSQATVSSGNGVKRTYATQRSHLAEENPEDAIIAGLLDDTPKQPTTKSKAYGWSRTDSKKDAFNMDDSDEDGAATGAIRSLHELRAAGRNIRGTEDIEQILEDVENHSPGHKSRRRSGLIELATKLADKNFASRFIGQGCDVRLARQCSGPRDDIASFLISAAVANLLVADPPEHTLRTLQGAAVASWLGALLSSAKDITKMAKDRQYNMAKASQASLVQYAKFLQTLPTLWSEDFPAVMNTRLIALKGLDLLVGRLRRAGDKSELLSSDQLTLILPNDETASDAEIEMSMAISVLESLSTSSLILAWDQNLLQRIARTLISLDATTARRRHTFFLTLRLYLNLTNDNARNCGHLANAQSVQWLLKIVFDGFDTLDAETEEEIRTLALDLLVLALGILINLFEHSGEARSHAAHSAAPLTALVTTFTAGQQRMLEAESVAESISNVALGYLAVVLANLSQDPTARKVTRDALPGRRLSILGDAVEEFVLFHQQVDGMATAGFEGEEGAAVWGGFTEKLRVVLERVRSVEAEDTMEG